MAETISSSQALFRIDGFTPRQCELLQFLAEGKSNKEIAYDLKISYGTVKQHMVTLFRRLDVPNRAKATVIAQRLIRTYSQREDVEETSEEIAREGYEWRIISAGAMVLGDVPDHKPETMAQRNTDLAVVHKSVRKIVEALDGHCMATPCGGILFWFGHPKSHHDDADRLQNVVATIKSICQKLETKTPCFSRVGIGLACNTEVIAKNSNQLFAVGAFRMAMNLANLSLKESLPLATLQTQRLTNKPGLWTRLKTNDSVAAEKQGLGAVYAMSPANSDDMQLAQRWGGAAFMAGICQAVKPGLAQWLSVSAWPPSSIPSLMEGLAEIAHHEGFQVLHLRLPNRKTRDVLLNSLFMQVSSYCGDNPEVHADVRLTGGERLSSLLISAAQAKPLCVMVHGINAFEVFKGALTEKGIGRMVSQPILVVARGENPDEPEANVRSWGPRANGMPFTRAYVLPVPNMKRLLDEVRGDIQALLDELSPLARVIVTRAASETNKSFAEVVSEADEPNYKIQAALQELALVGLVVPSPSGGVQFRDPVLTEAIRDLAVTTLP